MKIRSSSTLLSLSAAVALSSCVGVPSGMIAAFDGACPAGWSQYEDANGKFLLAVSSIDSNGNPEYGITRAGGSNSVKLTVNNLPSHTHTMRFRRDDSSRTNGAGLVGGKVTNDPKQDGMTTLPAGKANPDDVTIPPPPFWTVNLCKSTDKSFFDTSG